MMESTGKKAIKDLFFFLIPEDRNKT